MLKTAVPILLGQVANSTGKLHFQHLQPLASFSAVLYSWGFQIKRKYKINATNQKIFKTFTDMQFVKI